MKKLVRLTHSVEVVVEGPTEDSIIDWASCHTPEDVKKIVGEDVAALNTTYNEEVIGSMPEDTIAVINAGCLTFRLYAGVKFNRTVKEGEYPVVGPFEFIMDGKRMFFDFTDISSRRDEKNENLVHFVLKNPDYECFKDLEFITKRMLEKVSEIEVFDVGTEEECLYPISLEYVSFILPYEEFEEIPIHPDVLKKVTPKQLGYYGEVENENERE